VVPQARLAAMRTSEENWESLFVAPDVLSPFAARLINPTGTVFQNGRGTRTGQDKFFILSAAEALAAGLPVVTSAIGGGAEVVTPACGVLVPPNDPDALAEVLRGLIGSRAERERLGAAGPGRARELCDPAAAMNRLQDLLTSVTDPRPAEAMS